ncbi:MAG: hypothetical protein H0T56_09560 [Pseudaminobacter sp.]|nr:hypothetical protein [Pseudaminobacter sp.]
MADDPPQQFSIIDHLYELHEKIEEDLATLQNEWENDLIYYPGIVEAVHFLGGYGFEGRLGLSTMDLSKFNRSRGPVETATISKIASRVQSLLKEMEGEVRSMARDAPVPPMRAPLPQINDDEKVSGAVVIQPVKWVPVPRRQHGDLIAHISALLDEAVYLARTTNLPPDRVALSQLERAQLVALMETTLALLKGPLVEKGLLKKVADAAKDGAISAAKRNTEMALGYALGKLTEGMLKLLGYL